MKNTVFDTYALYDASGNRHDFVLMEIDQALQLGTTSLTDLNQQDFFKVIYITEGEGVYYADWQAFELKKGDICFVGNAEQQRWSVSKSIKGYIINFKSVFLTKFITNHLFVQELAFLIDSLHIIYWIIML
ncbi:AraC family ligand binding domain-containing protein [Myroides sp. mNGS23_01]|nr:AraC family ligand binding domain-containing protein [Myroides sp. mNGS23_01]WHT38916.1 AraC family ligand binding domain-containing protein [Myroides sp. mNGS23_01]